MGKIKHIIQIIIQLYLVGVTVYLLFFMAPKTVNNKEVKEIIYRTEIKQAKADSLRERIYKVDLSYLEDKIDSLIKHRKQLRDTVLIIKVQDKIIEDQEVLIDTLNTGIKDRDSLALAERNISKAKDTIIEQQQIKIKKKNKDIAKTTAIAVVLAFIALFK